MDDFNKKYVELSLTGNIPVHPRYLYEFEAPKDVDTIIELISYIDEDNDKKIDYITYINKENTRCIAANITPLVCCYKPQVNKGE